MSRELSYADQAELERKRAETAELVALAALLTWEAAVLQYEQSDRITVAPDREVARVLHGMLIARGVIPSERG